MYIYTRKYDKKKLTSASGSSGASGSSDSPSQGLAEPVGLNPENKSVSLYSQTCKRIDVKGRIRIW